MSILEKIKELEDRKQKRSEKYSELYIDRVKKLADNVKQRKLSNNPTYDNCLPAAQMRSIFFDLKKNYSRENSYALPSEMNARSKALWNRVVDAQQQSNTDPETFLKAQFAFFDKYFGRAPLIQQLATEAAITRANNYDKNTASAAVSGGIGYKVDKVTEFRIAERTLLQVQRAQGLSREEVYRNLVIPGYLFIPPDFLKIDPVYAKVVNEDG